jgi:hypothetical protein
MKVFKLIRSLDFLGESKSFSIKNDKIFKTIFGGFLSIIISFSFIFLFFILGDDFINKKNPNGYSKIKENPNSHTLMKNFDFFIGIQMINFDEKIINLEEYLYPLFSLNHNYFLKNGSIIFHQQEVPSIRCDKFKLGERIGKFNFNLSNYICPDISKIENQTIGGDFYKMENSTELVFHLSLCDYNKKNCKDEKKFKDLTENYIVLLNILIPDVIYRIDDYDSPFKVDLRLDRIFVNYYSFGWYDIMFSELKLEENNGNLLDTRYEDFALGPTDRIRISDVKHYQPNPVNKTTNKMNKKEMDFLVIYVAKNDRLYYFYRSYLAFSTVVANAASLIKTIIVMITFVYLYFNKLRYNTYLCNRLLFFEEENEISNNEKELKFLHLQRSQFNRDSINYSDNKFKDDENETIKKNLPLKNLKNISIRLEKAEFNRINKDFINLEEENKKIESDRISNIGLFRKEIKNPNKEIYTESKNNNNLYSEEIKSNLEINLKKLNEHKNNKFYCFFGKLLPIKNHNVQRIYNIYDIFSKKFNEKFDIFHYFQLDKNAEIFRRFLFNKHETEIFDLLSKKNYKVNLKNFDKIEKDTNINREKTNKMILDYLLSSESNSNKEKLLEIFLY